MITFFCGVDLGQSNDPTAIVIVEKIQPSRDPALYHARHVERLPLGTSYPQVVRSVHQLVQSTALYKKVSLVIDHTGVGRPVFDQFREAQLDCPLNAVTITGGDTVQQEGTWYRVPKRDLIGAAQVLLQDHRLKIAPTLPEAPMLVKELQNFRVKIDPKTAHDSYSAWREGIHDDLVLALSLACWMGERNKGELMW